jgi:membrane protein YdbS with pleckstrin-like domain
MSSKDEDLSNEPGLGWRVSTSIFISLGWFAFVILWFTFFSSGWPFYQSIAIVLVSVLILVLVLSLMWVPWGLKHGRKYMKKE